MKLIIDRGIDKPAIYSFSFGMDFDVLIGSWDIYINSIPKETMSDIDKIVTNSPDLVFCVTHIKHPLLLEGKFSLNDDYYGYSSCKDLREYFALRLIHRRYDLKLYEFGKRFF